MRGSLSKFKSALIERLVQIPGWHSKKKIVVFESDDWGMVRMASKEAYDYFLDRGYEVNRCPYNRNDALETGSDVEMLYEVLDSVKDASGNPGRFTMNNVMGNPDFEAIKNADFRQYHWESFTKTLESHEGSRNVMSLYKEGIDKGLIQPQFHGREHIGIGRWLNALKSGSEKHLAAFHFNMYTVHDKGISGCNKDFLNAFVQESPEYEDVEKRILSGLDEFERVWGFRSKSVIAPCYTWNSKIEPQLAQAGVKYLQGGRVQVIPVYDQEKRAQRYHSTGEKNHLEQIYLIRNVHFEPVEFPEKDHVDAAMKQIALAFEYKKPAIISSHRVNYIGSIHPQNRSNGLKQLGTLLKRITNKWPDVVFMSSDELGQLIESKY